MTKYELEIEGKLKIRDSSQYLEPSSIQYSRICRKYNPMGKLRKTRQLAGSLYLKYFIIKPDRNTIKVGRPKEIMYLLIKSKPLI